MGVETDILEIARFVAFISGNGLLSREFIAVFMTNSPEMVITVLALSKLGAVTPLINTSLRGLVFLIRDFSELNLGFWQHPKTLFRYLEY